MTTTQRVVTSTRSGQPLLVVPAPADSDPEDTPTGHLWVQDVDGVVFTVRESRVTEGGDYEGVVAAKRAAARAEREAADKAAYDAEVAKRDWTWTPFDGRAGTPR